MPSDLRAIASQITRNIRYLLWKERIPPRSWPSSLQYRLPQTWSMEDIRRLLDGCELPYERLQEVAAALNIADEELASGELVAEGGVNILTENLQFLIGSMEHGGKKQLASDLGVDPTTVSRWLGGRSVPPQRTLRQLSDRFGFPSTADLAADPIFLCARPVSMAEQRSWLHQRINDMSPEDLRELFPALERLLEER